MDIDIGCEKVKSIVSCYKHFLCNDAYEEVINYLENREPEMAYEGFLIEIINSDKNPEEIDKEQVLYVAKYLSLDYESVFDKNIWNKLLDYLKIS
ncbi:hypothetical protein [Candidatus Sororendozoicomonas aggregata]|uniref:hypothetical protein n=1 Tax=Candidatus Sororendozoicomonas aggregata TaxID=3073239 RepID=UPI002ED39E67